MRKMTSVTFCAAWFIMVNVLGRHLHCTQSSVKERCSTIIKVQHDEDDDLNNIISGRSALDGQWFDVSHVFSLVTYFCHLGLILLLVGTFHMSRELRRINLQARCAGRETVEIHGSVSINVERNTRCGLSLVVPKWLSTGSPLLN